MDITVVRTAALFGCDSVNGDYIICNASFPRTVLKLVIVGALFCELFN